MSHFYLCIFVLPVCICIIKHWHSSGSFTWDTGYPLVYMFALVVFFLIYKTIWNILEESVNGSRINNIFIHKQSTISAFQFSIHSCTHLLYFFRNYFPPNEIMQSFSCGGSYLRAFFFGFIIFYVRLADSGGKIKTNNTSEPLVLLIHHPRLYSEILPFLCHSDPQQTSATQGVLVEPSRRFCFVFCDKRAISTINDVGNLSTESFFCVCNFFNSFFQSIVLP